MKSVFFFFAFFLSLHSFFFKWEVLLGEGKDVGRGKEEEKRQREKRQEKFYVPLQSLLSFSVLYT